MLFEVTLLLTVALMAGLCFWHSWRARGPRQSWMLLTCGVGFGYIFPFIDINLFEQYVFHGRITVFNFPLHLGFAWYGLYYMSLSLAERVAGSGAERWKTAALAGCIFGLLEAQWDPVLLQRGVMELFLPSFAEWPLGFNPGVPMCHAMFGFCWCYGFLLLRAAPRVGLATGVLLAFLVIWPLGIMAGVPFMEPIYAWPAEQGWSLGQRMALDSVHFFTIFLPSSFVAAFALRRIARWLGAE